MFITIPNIFWQFLSDC